MRKALLSMLFTAVAFCGSTAPANAGIGWWDYLEQLSGPGHFWFKGFILDGTVAQASYPGGVWRHVVKIGDQQVVVDSSRAFASGESVSVRVPAEALFLFDGGVSDAKGVIL